MDLTNEDVADILALLDSLPYDSLDIETPRFRLTLRRAAGGGWTSESRVVNEPTAVTPATPARQATAGSPANPTRQATVGSQANPARPPAAPPVASSGLSAPDAAGASRDGSADADGLVAVVTPLPGTFYRAPRPGAAAFVEVGDTVAADTVVAIVETMKLMNSVHAGTAGRVARICVDNGEFAVLGSTLILIEPEP
jgi:acetyl-CoA carboxylase biotin carboxyl carrier protein